VEQPGILPGYLYKDTFGKLLKVRPGCGFARDLPVLSDRWLSRHRELLQSQVQRDTATNTRGPSRNGIECATQPREIKRASDGGPGTISLLKYPKFDPTQPTFERVPQTNQ